MKYRLLLYVAALLITFTGCIKEDGSIMAEYLRLETCLYENNDIHRVDSVTGPINIKVKIEGKDIIEKRMDIYYVNLDSVKVHKSVHFWKDEKTGKYKPRYDVLER